MEKKISPILDREQPITTPSSTRETTPKMPLYNYHCNECGHDFEKMAKISDRFEPTNDQCPRCFSTAGNIALVVNAPKIVREHGDVRSKTSSTFRDNMKRIKELHPRNRIETA